MIPEIVLLCDGKVLEESCRGIRDALTLLNIESSTQDFSSAPKPASDTVYIILGLHNYKGHLPDKFIAVQSEQTTSKWFTPAYVEALKKAQFVWDFSPQNVSRCIGLGIANVCWVPVRVPMDVFVLNTKSFNLHFGSQCNKDIDVLFYGSDSRRRREMYRLLSSIPRCRLVFRYYNLFDEERENLLRRAKIVLNLHYWPDGALEVHRVEYACSRGKCVISEPSADPMLDKTYSNCVDFANYRDIPERITYLLRNDRVRLALEQEAQRQSFKKQFDVSAIKGCIFSLTRHHP